MSNSFALILLELFQLLMTMIQDMQFYEVLDGFSILGALVLIITCYQINLV